MKNNMGRKLSCFSCLICFVLFSFLIVSAIKDGAEKISNLYDKNYGIDCVDGDTFKIGKTSYRLAYVDTPEVGSIGARKASNFTCNWINQKDFKIEEKGKDKYGRTIAYVYSGQESLSNELVRNCLAEPFWTNTTSYIKFLYNKCI